MTGGHEDLQRPATTRSALCLDQGQGQTYDQPPLLTKKAPSVCSSKDKSEIGTPDHL